MKKLTVAISCYNFQDYIEECIHSILKQKTNFDFDIIIKDDYSKDNSRDVIKKLSEKYSHIRSIKYIFDEVNVGVNKNVAKLLSSCDSQYISLIDGDDFFSDENKLQNQVDFLEQNTEFVMHSTAYRYIYKNGNIVPTEVDKWLCGLKENVTIEDLLEKNIVTFGRTFRNLQSVFKELINKKYYLDTPYDDWALNFEILKYGKAKCEDWPTGYYRITGTGVLTNDSDEVLNQKNEICRKILREEYLNFKVINHKPIAIVDSFVHKKEVEIKLIECIDRLKQDNIPILLVSNSKINPEILEKVDHFFYDERNQLFTDGKFTNVRDIDLFKDNDVFEAHEIKSGLQKHGLSVLVNIFNSLNYAKSLGYTHFFRFEVDDEFGQKSREFIKEVPKLVLENNKKALFYFNEGEFHNGVNDSEPENVSFHFMYSEIDFFLSNIPKISDESDYEKYLLSTKGNLDFEIAEEFIYNNLIKADQNLILKKSGLVDMKNDFPDTEWNKIVSESNMSGKFNGCTTLIYQVHKFPPGVSSILNPWKGDKTDQICIMSYNYRDTPIERKIEIVFKDGNKTEIVHNLPWNGSWSFNTFDRNVDKINVYENEQFLYEDKTETAKNYIVLR